MTREEKKKHDYEISHLEVILLVLVAFMELIHINKIVMLFINKIVIASKKINRPSPSQVNGQKIEKGRRQGKEDKRLKEEKKD